MTEMIIFAWLCGLTFVVLLNSYWIGRLEQRLESRLEWVITVLRGLVK